MRVLWKLVVLNEASKKWEGVKKLDLCDAITYIEDFRNCYSIHVELCEFSAIVRTR